MNPTRYLVSGLFAIALLLTLAPAKAETNLLAEKGWQPRQAWQAKEQHWTIHQEGERTMIRLLKSPTVLDHSVAFDGTQAKLKFSADLRLADVEIDGQWGAPHIEVGFLDAAGKPIKAGAWVAFYREDRDWGQVSRELDVPEQAKSMRVTLGIRAKKGTADFSNLKLTVLETRDAPAPDQAQATAAGAAAGSSAASSIAKGEQLLKDTGWKPRQNWMGKGSSWDTFEDGDRKGISLMKSPVVLSQTVATDGSVARIGFSTKAKLTDIVPEGRWGVPVVTVKSLNAKGGAIGEPSQRFLREHTDWTDVSFNVDVPAETHAIEVVFESRVKSGTAQFASPSIEVLETRAAPARAAAASTPAAADADPRANRRPAGPKGHGKPDIAMHRPMEKWGASVDESKIDRVIHVGVDQQGANDSNDGLDRNKPMKTFAASLARAGALLSEGQSVKILVAPGVYREREVRLDASKLKDKAANAVLIVEAEKPGTVFFRGSDKVASNNGWTLVDAEKRIYRRDWPHQTFNPVDPESYNPAIPTISRRRVMVFVNGQWLAPVVLEQYTHETKVTTRNRPEGGVDNIRNVTDAYVSFVNPAEALQPGQFGVAELGPGDADFDKSPHPHPDSLFVRLPKGVTDIADSTVEVTRSSSGGVRFDNKNNIVLRNLTFEHYGIAAIRVFDARNILLDHVTAQWNDGGDGASTVRLMHVEEATLRNTKIVHNGPFGLHLFGKYMLLEDTDVSHNNWRGGLSGHVMHGVGGVSLYAGHIRIVRSKFNHNHGFGFRHDVYGGHLVIEDSQFNQNLANGGVFLELGYGPALFRNVEIVGNRGRGLHILCFHGVTVKDSVIANNLDAQVNIYPMDNRGVRLRQDAPLYSGPGVWLDGDPRPTNGLLGIIGVEDTLIENTIVAVTDPSLTEAKLYRGNYWAGTQMEYERWLTQEMTGKSNRYWHAASAPAFDVAGLHGKPGEPGDFAAWQSVVKQDVGATWVKPEKDLPTVPPAPVVPKNETPVEHQ